MDRPAANSTGRAVKISSNKRRQHNEHEGFLITRPHRFRDQFIPPVILPWQQFRDSNHDLFAKARLFIELSQLRLHIDEIYIQRLIFRIFPSRIA